LWLVHQSGEKPLPDNGKLSYVVGRLPVMTMIESRLSVTVDHNGHVHMTTVSGQTRTVTPLLTQSGRDAGHLELSVQSPFEWWSDFTSC
jgi:hypothetical protein